MPLLPFGEHQPSIDSRATIAPEATVIGQVAVGPESCVWPGTVIRGDHDRVELGSHVHLQEGCTVHVDRGCPTIIGDEVVVEPGAVVHGCVLEGQSLVEAGARLLSRSRVGQGTIVRAGALVPEGAAIPPRSVVAGVPGRVQRQTTDDEVAQISQRARQLSQQASALFRSARTRTTRSGPTSRRPANWPTTGATGWPGPARGAPTWSSWRGLAGTSAWRRGWRRCRPRSSQPAAWTCTPGASST